MVALPVAENVNLLMRSPKSLKVAGIAPGINGTALAAAETAVFVVCIVVITPVNVEMILLIPSITFVKVFNSITIPTIITISHAQIFIIKIA